MTQELGIQGLKNRTRMNTDATDYRGFVRGSEMIGPSQPCGDGVIKAKMERGLG
jgi:hypothetical protein